MSKVIEIVPYDSLPCAAATFTIGGVTADKDDFGEQCDVHPEDAEDYACGSNQFTPYANVRLEVLEKYNITEAEYRALQAELESKFYVGGCGWCV